MNKGYRIQDSEEIESQKLFSENGFTLIEVMIAMVVLILGLLGVMGMQYYSISGNAVSRELRLATNLSSEVIEQMKSTPYGNVANGGDNPLVDTAMSGNVVFTRSWQVFANCVGIAADNNLCPVAAGCASAPDAGLVVPVSAIRARTCWQDRNGTNHSVTLDTIRWNENVTP